METRQANVAADCAQATKPGWFQSCHSPSVGLEGGEGQCRQGNSIGAELVEELHSFKSIRKTLATTGAQRTLEPIEVVNAQKGRVRCRQRSNPCFTPGVAYLSIDLSFIFICKSVSVNETAPYGLPFFKKTPNLL